MQGEGRGVSDPTRKKEAPAITQSFAAETPAISGEGRLV